MFVVAVQPMSSSSFPEKYDKTAVGPFESEVLALQWLTKEGWKKVDNMFYNNMFHKVGNPRTAYLLELKSPDWSLDLSKS